MEIFRNLLNGVIIGSSMLLPGVSGGSMAIILGVYDKLILAVSDLRKDFKKNFVFLLTYAAGGAIGIALFAKALLYLTDTYVNPMLFLFLGAIIGSLPLLIKKANIQKGSFSFIYIAYIAIGCLLVLTVDMLPEGLFTFDNSLQIIDYFILSFLGIALSVALVLPGISFSYMLLILGVYKPALSAIETMNIPFLLALGAGILAGVLLTTKLLGYVLKKYPTETFLIIIGFVLSTLKDVFPGIPSMSELFICVLTFGAGILITILLARWAKE